MIEAGALYNLEIKLLALLYHVYTVGGKLNI